MAVSTQTESQEQAEELQTLRDELDDLRETMYTMKSILKPAARGVEQLFDFANRTDEHLNWEIGVPQASSSTLNLTDEVDKL